MSRFLTPEIVRLNLSGGDWITVKRELTAGEQRRAFARTTKRVIAGSPIELDLEKARLTTVVEYLVDWSFLDAAGKAVKIRDEPAEVVIDILNSLDGESLSEIFEAIEAHEKTVAAEKKTRATVIVS